MHLIVATILTPIILPRWKPEEFPMIAKGVKETSQETSSFYTILFLSVGHVDVQCNNVISAFLPASRSRSLFQKNEGSAPKHVSQHVIKKTTLVACGGPEQFRDDSAMKTWEVWC
jgi:hypothetical protein